MSLQEKLDAQRERFEEHAPEEAVSVMHRATEALERSGQVEEAAGVGDRAPDFALPDADGETVRLEELRARGPVILGFFRGRW